MQRLFSKIVGTPVFEEDFGRPVTTVKDLVIDPENGKVVALLVDFGRNKVISPIDIYSWTEVIRIHNGEAIVDGNEILRVESVQKSGAYVFGNKVFSKDEEYLGRVVDYTIDSQGLGLDKIFTAKVILGMLRYDNRIIPAKDIVEILPNKIVVKGGKEAVTENGEAIATDLAGA